MERYAQRSTPRTVLTRPDGPTLRITQRCSLGSAVSPALANLFLHYALDAWLMKTFPDVEFARYVDDAVVHCRSEARAIAVRDAIAERMRQVGLRLHPDKTRIVYCQDSNRKGSYEHTSFTFLGFTFRQREARNRWGRHFSGFLPARSDAAQKKMNATVGSWKLHYKTNLTLDDLARWVNPIVRGWMQYYGAFYRSKLHPLLERINSYLMRFLRRKLKRLRSKKRALQYWKRTVAKRRGLFAHWAWATFTPMPPVRNSGGGGKPLFHAGSIERYEKCFAAASKDQVGGILSAVAPKSKHCIRDHY